MTIAYPIRRALLSTGGPEGRTTGAQNYDEFADDAEITGIIAANPTSALGVEMPHRAPDTLGVSFADSLPAARERLSAAVAEGRYAPYEQAVVVYGITAPGGPTGYGLWCMVDTDQISTSADEPGLVIRNEDVFIEKVRERVALAGAVGHLLSPVLMLATEHGKRLHAALAAAAADLGEPVCVDTDQVGRRHEIWPVPAGAVRDELLDLAGGGELVVADGNHRSLAAQLAHLPRFLAVITTAESVAIQPYNRLVAGVDVDPDALAERLRAAGASVAGAAAPPRVPTAGGTVHVYAGGRALAVTLPPRPGADPVDNLDHALVERVLLGEVLGLDAGDKAITYVGGDYGADWLVGEVDAGRAALAVLIAPVTVDDFVAVNLARHKLPRKSTWFTPKARAGLVVADLSAEA
ncbi:MAG TPA: DUF1015 family protein [Micromonosporaceae bacterium]|nr:DUF1015 family protein [Micromonosporaceae bacterium]